MDRLQHYLSALKEYARDYILENTGLKVLALLITAVLWLSVASRPVRQITMQNVPIEFRNWPESPTLTVSRYETLSARVYLEGPRDVVESLRPSEVTVIADMTGVEPGVRVRPLTLDASRLPASVKGEVEPRGIRVTVERVIEKDLPIKPRFDGQPAPGYEVVGSQITPPTVRISGAESQVRDIAEVSTETVSLTDKTHTFSESVAIDIGSPNLNISEQGLRKVQLTVIINEVPKERTIEHVPVVLFNAPPGAQPQPKYVNVTLVGPRSAVDELTSADVNVAVDLQAEGSGPRLFTPKVTISPNHSDKVNARAVEPAHIRVKQ
ncbi:MAG TPA: CdaR family protein [Blastocatellia bacterium]|nr:CdaR family protein [Blastocatellia bacterium]